MKSKRSGIYLISFLAAWMCFSASGKIHAFQDPAQTAATPAPSITEEHDNDSKARTDDAAPGAGNESGEKGTDIFYGNFPTNSGNDRVKIGGGQKVSPDETVADMVTVFGSSKMAGSTTGDMVTVFGDAVMTGKVTGKMVTVFGDAEINGPVNGDVVVIFGSLKTGPAAEVNGECSVIFGKLDFEGSPGGKFRQEYVEVMPWLFSLKDYVKSGPLLGRLLPPGSTIAWIVVAFHFIIYFLFALVIRKPTAACVRQIEENALLSFGVGILTMILLAPLSFILVLTGVGIILVPLIGLAEMVFAILGKTAVLEYFGLQILRKRGSSADARPIWAFLLGFALVTIVYMIPILGLLVWFFLRPFALGAAIMAVFRSIRKNGAGSSAPGIPVPSAPDQKAKPDAPPPPDSPYTAEATQSASEAAVPFTRPSAAEIVTLPRAGFWIRIAANLLDIILFSWLLVFAQELFLFFLLAYHVAMWTWKGTTIGGIICRIKAVRLDGNPLDFGVSLVRGLTAIFSAAALGLGFFWTGWTHNRQSWHDMIAGTVIVRVPQPISMI